MRNEIKIMLPIYKIIYLILFICFLAILRGTADTREIGVTLDPMMAALSVVFMSDTYLIEKREQRWEIFALYTLDKKRIMLYKRIVVQFSYLFLLSALGYFLFFIQNPSVTTWVDEMKMYLEYLLVVGISLLLWGTTAIVIANVFKNIWCGIGITFLIWLLFNSTFGDNLFGRYNIFSYVFRDYRQVIVDWIPGKIIGFILAMLMIFVFLPQTIKTRRN